MIRAGKAGPDSAWPEALIASVRNLPAHSGLYVALSGGLDSVLLLHTLVRHVRNSDRLTAVHVNHQLQPNAGETESFCRRLCDALSVPCQIRRVEVSATPSGNFPGTGGLEEAAREARYQAFRSCLEDNDLLVMAHHADDQTETVLFRLLRGTGVAGLGGMPVIRVLGNGTLYRPFLNFSRQQLEAWARELSVDWVEDPSNQDQRFDRNYLRKTIIPALKERWPSLNRRLASTARACSESDEIARSLGSLHFSRCGTADGGLDLSLLAGLTLVEQKNLIRWWVGRQQCSPPSLADWRGLMSDFIDSGDDRQPEYCGDDYVIRRHQNTLYLVKGQAVTGDEGAQVLPGQETAWGEWRLQLQAANADSGTAPELRVFLRQGGERIRARAGGPSKSLKNWLQEQAVPAWERSSLPLVKDTASDKHELVAVGHLWISEHYSGKAPASGWRLILERESD
jgi:tRNA(Ile)-lysidine synthase